MSGVCGVNEAVQLRVGENNFGDRSVPFTAKRGAADLTQAYARAVGARERRITALDADDLPRPQRKCLRGRDVKQRIKRYPKVRSTARPFTPQIV